MNIILEDTRGIIINRLLLVCFLFLLFSCRVKAPENGAESTLIGSDSCDYYTLIIKGVKNDKDYDSIRSLLATTIYNSERIGKSLFFQVGQHDDPTLYLHARYENSIWKTVVVCNKSDVDTTQMSEVLDVSNSLMNKIQKAYYFDEMYFYCSIHQIDR